jgi:hypothetical protein
MTTTPKPCKGSTVSENDSPIPLAELVAWLEARDARMGDDFPHFRSALHYLAAAPEPPAPGVGADAKVALGFVYDHLEAMDNQDVPLAEIPQRIVDALAGAGWAVVPCALPFAVLGTAAMMAETGNPKFTWDYLIGQTRIYPRTAPDASIAAQYLATPPAPSAGVSVSEVTPAEIMAACNTIYPQFDHYSGDTRADIRRDVENALTAFLDGRAAAQVRANDSGVGK